MTLRNKDGTIYRLKSPNPISKNQDFWETDAEYVLHNCKWTPEIINKEELEKIISAINFSEKTVVDAKINEHPIEKYVPIIDNVPDVIPQPIKEDFQKTQKLPDSIIKNSVIFWCLPTIDSTVFDNLYEEKHEIKKYGNKFTFEAIVLEKNDMEISFWTNAEKVNKNSIVYPSRYTYRKEEYKDYRWWKIQTITAKSGGWLVYAIVSEITPDFSD